MNWEKIQTVFLDMDGTLLDLSFDSRFWYEFVPYEYAKKHNIELKFAIEELSKKYKSMIGTLDWYCTDYWSDYLKINLKEINYKYKSNIKIFPKTKLFLETLRRKGKNITLLTNAHRDTINIKLNETKLWEFFDCVISSHDYKTPKESNEFWRKLESENIFLKESSILIDDNINVLKYAKIYGIKYLIEITYPDSTKKEKSGSEFTSVSNICELTMN